MKVQQLWGVSTRVVMWIAGDQEVRIDATGVGTEAARARRRSCSTPKVDDTVSTHASLRASVQRNPILHAVVSCKWTLRGDRAQNARSEALNLVRNRRAAYPTWASSPARPPPVRISSLALGTGDIDCVYHFACPSCSPPSEQTHQRHRRPPPQSGKLQRTSQQG